MIDLFCTLFTTEEGPFGAETFCQVKLSTTCLTLKNEQIPIHTVDVVMNLYSFRNTFLHE